MTRDIGISAPSPDLFDIHYRINYVFGFSAGGFSYFVTTQRKTTQSSDFVSKLVRLCENDEEYISYTEIPILCTSKTGENYNLVQVRFFFYSLHLQFIIKIPFIDKSVHHSHFCPRRNKFRRELQFAMGRCLLSVCLHLFQDLRLDYFQFELESSNLV